MLVQRGEASQEDVDAALKEQRALRLRIGELLVRRGVSPEAVARALAAQLHLSYAGAPLRPEPTALTVIDAEFAARNRIVPLRIRNGGLVVATADPLDAAVLDAVQFRCRRRVEPVIATPGAIDAALGMAYQDRTVAALLARLPARASREEDVEDAGALQQASEAAPVVGIVELIFSRAVELRASDIHIEPERRGVRVRIRVDGALRELLRLPVDAAPAVISRLKVLAALDIAERRRPQDGRASLRLFERGIAARVSTLPSLEGEKVVIRLLDTQDVVRPLGELGISPEPLARLEAMIAQPHGLVLVTGPTGSGKTTTLYAALAGLDRETRNVITLEDPVEYRLPGLTQVQIHAKAGLDFAAALRAVLRQDPDVIMVGELRDRETTKIALAAAMTGHLVLSTLHTNDAPSAATRLIDMGAPPYVVAAALIGVVAQRLVRRRCPDCRGVVEADSTAVAPCGRCAGSGLAGRLGIYEVMPVRNRLRSLLGRRAPASVLREAALAEGMVPLERDAEAKLEAGLTVMPEVAPYLGTLPRRLPTV
jgi:type IV pilus assembly protein PilB